MQEQMRELNIKDSIQQPWREYNQVLAWCNSTADTEKVTCQFVQELLAIVLPDKEFVLKSRDARGDQQDSLRQDNSNDGEEMIIQRYRKLKDSAT
jgi:hypothetical protein